MTCVRAGTSSISTADGSREPQAILRVACPTGLTATTVDGSTNIMGCHRTAFEARPVFPPDTNSHNSGRAIPAFGWRVTFNRQERTHHEKDHPNYRICHRRQYCGHCATTRPNDFWAGCDLY